MTSTCNRFITGLKISTFIVFLMTPLKNHPGEGLVKLHADALKFGFESGNALRYRESHSSE